MGLSKELKAELHGKLDKPRPRPFMYIGKKDGVKVYCRKQSLSYFQLLEKYPHPSAVVVLPKSRHIFKKQHHLKPVKDNSDFWAYVLWGSIGTFVVFSVAFYAVAGIWSLL